MTKPKLFVLLFGLCCWPQLSAYAEERMRVGISAVSLEHVLVPCAIATNALLSEDLDYTVCTGRELPERLKDCRSS
jgi:hypothetical protein